MTMWFNLIQAKKKESRWSGCKRVQSGQTFECIKKHILHIRVIRIEKFQITHAQMDGQTSLCIIFEKIYEFYLLNCNILNMQKKTHQVSQYDVKLQHLWLVNNIRAKLIFKINGNFIVTYRKIKIRFIKCISVKNKRIDGCMWKNKPASLISTGNTTPSHD